MARPSGVLGALAMRAVFIVLGGAFLQRFHWAIYVFGGILAITGIKSTRFNLTYLMIAVLGVFMLHEKAASGARPLPREVA